MLDMLANTHATRINYRQLVCRKACYSAFGRLRQRSLMSQRVWANKQSSEQAKAFQVDGLYVKKAATIRIHHPHHPTLHYFNSDFPHSLV